MFTVCASQAAARKAQPLWQQLGFQAKIKERKIMIVLGSDKNWPLYECSTEYLTTQ